MTIEELQSKWNTFDPYSEGYLLISGEHPLSFHIGYHNDEQKSFIVLNTGKIEKLKSSKAITAECIKIDQQYILRFVLHYPSLDEIFIKLCWDLMETSKVSPNPVNQICNQYTKWMRLLQKATDDILPPSQQKGLVGELLYLQESLAKFKPDRAINAWTGPEGSDQDFDFYDRWAEIKAVTIAATDVQISSLQQLDREDMGHVVVYFMDRTTSTGIHTISLPKLIRQIEEILPTNLLQDMFHCKLTQYGYLKRDEEKYLSVHYRLAECHTYEVTSDSPKLVRANVPDAVVGTKYRLDLSMLERWRI